MGRWRSAFDFLFPRASRAVSACKRFRTLGSRGNKEIPMIRLRLPFALTLAALSTLALGAAGCSGGQSPTEPARLDAGTKSASLDVKRHGADDPAGDDHGGRQGGGADDPAGDDRGGRQKPPAPVPTPRPARGQELEGAV